MATWIRLAKRPGEKPERYVKAVPLTGKVFDRSDILLILGCDFEIIQLPSDDWLCMRADYMLEEHGRNNLASDLANHPVYGDAILLDFKEYKR